jgi:two-component system copper resistance phosphate regulon response regulator CusR
MRILLVEDELKAAGFIGRGLREQGFSLDVASTGPEGLELALVHPYDLVILDILLPGLDGWSILAALRTAGEEVPVLVLTARDAVEDRVRGLEMGADDYLVKPFAFSELLARARTLLRRRGPKAPGLLRVADLTVDALAHRATRAGRPVELTAKEFALLLLFMRHTGEVLSRTLIAEKVWDMNFDGDSNVIDVAVRRLRRKIDEPFETALIHSVRGRGYVFEQRPD